MVRSPSEEDIGALEQAVHGYWPRLSLHQVLASQGAAERGFDNAVVLDHEGNVAELATANIWIAKDGAAHTPVATGTFMCGITRYRVGQLLRDSGIEVHERTVTWQDVLEADEVFTTGNFSKVLPITRVEDRGMQPGPVYRRPRELYFDWAHGDAAAAKKAKRA